MVHDPFDPDMIAQLRPVAYQRDRDGVYQQPDSVGR